MKIQFDCVFYFVSDLDRSVRFYSDVLGLRLKSRDAVARFNVDGVLFELVPSLGEANRRNQETRACACKFKMWKKLSRNCAARVSQPLPRRRNRTGFWVRSLIPTATKSACGSMIADLPAEPGRP